MSAFTNFTLELEAQFKREMFRFYMDLFDEFRAQEGSVSPEEAEASALVAECDAECFREELRLNTHDMVAGHVRDEVSRQNLEVKPGEPAWPKVMRSGKEVMIQVALGEARRWRHGDSDDTLAYRALNLVHPSDLPAGPPIIALSAQAKRPLSVIYEECRANRIEKSKWKESTATSKDFSVRLFRELVGDIRLDQITAEHAYQFDCLLQRMPAMIGKSIYAGLTAPEAIKRFEALRSKIEQDRADGRISVEQANRRLAEAKCQRMEPHTRNKHINAMASVFTWARTVRKWVQLEDHFAAYRMDRPARRRQPKKRVALKLPRLLEILQSPRFTGRKTDTARGQTIPGDLVIKDGLYWSVLLEAFQGCRLDEGAKLRAFEVFKKYGMWCLRLNFDGDEDGVGETEAGNGKTEASKREVPMHRVLVRLGLPEQATRVAEAHRKEGTKKEEQWLFTDLTVSEVHGTRSANLTKRWATYLKTARLYKRWEDGHALRHTFNNTLRRAGVPKPVIRELMGHSQKEDMTDDTYFTESTLRELKEALDKLDYGLPLEERDGEWQIAKPSAGK